MELVMTDERLYRDGPPNGNQIQDRYLTPGNPTPGQGEESPSRTILGWAPDEMVPSGSPYASQQKDFFVERMLGSQRKWKIWGNEVTFMQFKAFDSNADPDLISTLFPGTPMSGPVVPGPDGVYVTLDQWDGFQAERDEIIDRIASQNVENFITITGDIHTFIAGYIRQNFDDLTSQRQGPTEPNTPAPPPPPDAVGVEFVCGSVTSANLTELATFGRGRSTLPGTPGDAESRRDVSEALQETNNRHFKYFNSDTHGYNVIEATLEKLTCTMRSVSTIKAPTATLSTLKVFEVPDEVVRIDDVTPAP